MSKESKNMTVPKLRFPEFSKDGDWKEKKLGDCLLAHPDYGINAPAVPYSSRLPTYLRITDISEDGHFLSKNKVSVEKEVSENNYLQKGDIVIARTGASVGKSYKYRSDDGELVFAGFLIRVRPDKSELNAELLFQYLSSQKYWSWVSFTSMRSGQPGINGNEYASLPIPLPKSLSEQQKIASCLSSLDDLITTENQKLGVLKAHKKGLMQRLFPVNGQITPKLRFAEFRGSGEWEEKKLGDVAEIITGNTPSTKESENYDGNFLFVSPADITGRRYITQTKTTLSEIGFSKTRHISANSVLFVCIGSTIGKVAQNKFECATNQQINSVVPVNGYSSSFLYSLLENSTFKIASLAGRQAVPIINKSLFSSIELFFPPTIEEQQKIALCLSSLDEFITSQAEKIEALKEHKKGLMQGLFPGLNEINE